MHLGLVHKALVHEKIQTHIDLEQKEALKRHSEAVEDASGTRILFLDCLPYAPCNQLHRPSKVWKRLQEGIFGRGTEQPVSLHRTGRLHQLSRKLQS